MPPTKPSASAGRSPIAIAMKPANIFKPCRQRGNRTKVYTLVERKCIHIHTETINQKRNRNQDAAADYKRKHVGDTIHQLRVNLVSDTARFAARGCLCRAAASR